MRTEVDRFLACHGMLLALFLGLVGCFSSVKQKDAGAPKGDTSAPETNQPGVDAISGSGGRVVFDANGGSAGSGSVDAPGSGGGGTGGVLGSGGSLSTGGGGGTGGVLDSGGSASTGGSAGSGGTVADAHTPDVPIPSDGPDAPTTLSNGSPCTSDTQCANSHCADGVCCDGKCDGQCQSCNEKNSVGKCIAVQGDPRGQRLACGGTAPCKGQCDGNNVIACTFPNSSTVCSQASCTSGTLTQSSSCDGAGNCPAAKVGPCASNLCTTDGKGCAPSCSGTPCATGSYCDGTSCVPKKTSGACASGTECVTGYCADGVCCNTPCTEQCKACNLSGSSGTCTRLSSGAPAANHTACTGSSPCVGSCNTTSDSCVYPGASQTCGAAASCSADLTTVNSSVCDGKGACSPTPQNCGSTGYCNNASCTPKLNSGSCTSNVQCVSGNCSNGTCCGSGQTGCSGTCVDLTTNTLNCGTCGRSCSGQACCAGTCADLNNSNSNCGTCGHSCGSQICMSAICCDSIYTACGGGCCDTNHTCSGSTCSCLGRSFTCGGCGAWNFESGTEGWVATPVSLAASASCNTVQSFGVISGTATQGTHSLTVRIDNPVTCSSSVIAEFGIPLCSSGAAVTVPAGTTISADFLFASDPGQSISSYAPFHAEFLGPADSQSAFDPNIGTVVPDGRWFTFTGTLSAAVNASFVGFNWWPLGTVGSNWTGTIYMDRVRISQ